jgi:membrane protease YdiL (CAAX protease family)
MVLAAVLGYLLVFSLGAWAVAALGWALSDRSLGLTAYYDWAVVGFGSPWGVWAAHFGLSVLVLLIWALYRFWHRRRLDWLWSVAPGVRWRYGLAALLVALVLFGAYAALSYAQGPGWQPPAGWGWYLLPILLTSPLQALGEEVLFRGYLLQALGLIVRRPWFPIIASALLFAAFHGAQNLWLFASRFVFGLAAGALVWRSGGLEAGVAAHAVNNLAAFSLALVTGQLTQTRTVTDIGWAPALGDAGLFVLFAAAAWGVARGMRLVNRAPAPDRPPGRRS